MSENTGLTSLTRRRMMTVYYSANMWDFKPAGVKAVHAFFDAALKERNLVAVDFFYNPGSRMFHVQCPEDAAEQAQEILIEVARRVINQEANTGEYRDQEADTELIRPSLSQKQKDWYALTGVPEEVQWYSNRYSWNFPEPNKLLESIIPVEMQNKIGKLTSATLVQDPQAQKIHIGAHTEQNLHLAIHKLDNIVRFWRFSASHQECHIAYTEEIEDYELGIQSLQSMDWRMVRTTLLDNTTTPDWDMDGYNGNFQKLCMIRHCGYNHILCAYEKALPLAYNKHIDDLDKGLGYFIPEFCYAGKGDKSKIPILEVHKGISSSKPQSAVILIPEKNKSIQSWAQKLPSALLEEAFQLDEDEMTVASGLSTEKDRSEQQVKHELLGLNAFRPEEITNLLDERDALLDAFMDTHKEILIPTVAEKRIISATSEHHQVTSRTGVLENTDENRPDNKETYDERFLNLSQNFQQQDIGSPVLSLTAASSHGGLFSSPPWALPHKAAKSLASQDFDVASHKIMEQFLNPETSETPSEPLSLVHDVAISPLLLPTPTTKRSQFAMDMERIFGASKLSNSTGHRAALTVNKSKDSPSDGHPKPLSSPMAQVTNIITRSRASSDASFHSALSSLDRTGVHERLQTENEVDSREFHVTMKQMAPNPTSTKDAPRVPRTKWNISKTSQSPGSNSIIQSPPQTSKGTRTLTQRQLMTQEFPQKTIRKLKDPSDEFITKLRGAFLDLLARIRIFPGKIRVEAEFGRILMRPPKFQYGVDSKQDSDFMRDPDILLEMLNSQGFSQDFCMTRILTTVPADAHYILGLVSAGENLWQARSLSWEIKYEITFQDENNGTVFQVEIDAEKFCFNIKKCKPLDSTVWIHCTRRDWDFRFAAQAIESLESEYGSLAREIVSSLYIAPNLKDAALSFTVSHTYNVTLMHIRVLRICKYKSCNDQSSLNFTQVQVLNGSDKLSKDGTTRIISGEFSAKLMSQGQDSSVWTWIEMSISSLRAEEVFTKKENSELGEEAIWTVDEIMTAGVFDALYKPACLVVKEIDGVGRFNNNQLKKSELEENSPRKESTASKSVKSAASHTMPPNSSRRVGDSKFRW